MKNTYYYKKPEIISRLPVDSNAVIDASAGTGKTYTLEHLVVELLLNNDCSIEQILVVTFTRRATAEMKARVRKMIHKLMTESPAKAAAEPSGDWSTTHWRIDKSARRKLRSALDNFDKAQVYTIHGFCQRWITQYAFENNQLFDGELVDEKEIFYDCFYDILRSSYAVDETLKRFLDVWLFLGGGTTAIDALYEDLLAAYQDDAILLPEYSDVQKSEWLEKAEEYMANPDTANRFKEANKKAMIEAKFSLKTIIIQEFLDAIIDELNTRKSAQGYYTYDDIIAILDNTIKKGDDNAHKFVQTIRSHYQFGLVDEFQDTDKRQWNIFKSVFMGNDSQQRLFLIGDPKQSIYGFRGADVQTYQQACKELLDAGNSVELTLDHNYRSTPDIINAYNTIFKNDYFTKNNEPVAYEPVECGIDNISLKQMTNGKSTHPKPITVFEFNVPQEHLNQKKPRLANASTYRNALINALTNEIYNLLHGSPMEFHKGDSIRTLQAGDIFVLTKTNKEARQIGSALATLGIPHAFYRQEGLFQSDEAYHIYDVLRALCLLDDRKYRRKALHTPFFNIALKDIAERDAADISESNSPRALLLQWQQLAHKRRYRKLFEDMLLHTGISRREIFFNLSERALTNYQHIFELLIEETTRTNSLLPELVSWLKRRIDNSADKIADDVDLQRLETDRNAVQLMTLHKSKGLEAQVVFLFGGFGANNKGTKHLKDGDIKYGYISKDKNFMPEEHRNRHDCYKDEEAQRLYYVGITRAISKLYLPYIPNEHVNGKASVNGEYYVVQNRLKDLFDQPFVDKKIIYPLTEAQNNTAANESAQQSDNLLPTPLLSDLPELSVHIPEDKSEAYATLRSANNLDLTSYSAIKHIGARYRTTDDDNPNENKSGTASQDVDRDEFNASGLIPLPPGKQAGSLLHEIMENIDYSTVLKQGGWKQWYTQHSDIQQVFKNRFKKYRFDIDTYGNYAAYIIYNTLSNHIKELNAPLAKLDFKRIQHEVEFHFPIPDKTHPEFITHAAVRSVQRGYVTGFIDLLFEYQGKMYFVDWKSDTIPTGDYSFASVSRHVNEKYPSQAIIYTMAVSRILQLKNKDDYNKKFGGFFYFFMRGMSATTGVYFARPPWEDIVERERRLRLDDDTLAQEPQLDTWRKVMAVKNLDSQGASV